MKVHKSQHRISDILRQRKVDLNKEIESKPLKILMEEVDTRNSKSSKSGIFKDALAGIEDVAVICEYKPASPSMGDISDLKLEDAVNVFENAGASAISILTEEKYFKGSLNNLKSACNITNLPIIRKDFIIDEYQIFQAKYAGAGAVLLMSGIYPDIEKGVSLCLDLGMDPMVECKNREDIEQALRTDADILGINNRNFQDFSVDLKTTKKLSKYVPQEKILVSESGVRGHEDARMLSAYGSDALLIGTSIMGAEGKEGMLKAATDIIKSVEGARVVRR